MINYKRNSLDFVIHGGKKLKGKVRTNTSKNGAMGTMCASLLNRGVSILKGIPRIEEVNRIIEVMQSIGVNVVWQGKNTLKIDASGKIDLSKLDSEAGGRTRSILMFIGPLIHRFNKFSIPHSQGCKLGKRTAAAHIYALEDLGVDIDVQTDKYYVMHKNNFKAREIVMYEAGDTAVENTLLACALIPGITTIKFASSNYMVQDVCNFLEVMGVKIEGIGTTTLKVHGVKKIEGTYEYHNSEDPIEAMMWISTAICTKSNLTIERVPIDFLELELYKLAKMGLKFSKSESYLSHNNRTELVDIEIKPSKLKALSEKIDSRPYPGINIDNLPFFVPICALAEGESLIHDWVYENRAIYYMDLVKVGADMTLADPHRVIIKGKNELKPAEVVCPPALRPAMIVLIAMLAADGVSILRNVYSINRGYEEIAERLNMLGADVQILS